MKSLTAVIKELIGLFVEDGALALAIIVVVAIASISAAFLPGVPAVAGMILLLGCVGVLFASVMRARQR